MTTLQTRLLMAAGTLIALVIAYQVGLFRGIGIGERKAEGEWKPKVNALEKRVVVLEGEKELAEETARRARENERKRVATIADDLIKAQESISTLKGRINDAIAKHTSSTRACLPAHVVRVLNTGTEGSRGANPTGAVPGGTDATAAAAAADRGGHASERSVATALNDARKAYESCRALAHRLQDGVSAITGQPVLEQ